MARMAWRSRRDERERVRRKMRLAIALLTLIGVLAASAIYSFAGNLKVLKSDLDDGVANANDKGAGGIGTSNNVLPDGFTLREIAKGTDLLENPSGVITQFGFLSDGTPTEPDENTYVIFDHNPGGPDAHFDYGRHFLFQGHENAGDLAHATRINLDVDPVGDPAHRITLLTAVGADGKTHFNRIDGSTWNPFTKKLLFAQEDSANGGIIEISGDWPPNPTTLYGIIGRAAYEGIHPDNRGNLYLAEDTAGTAINVDPTNPLVKAAKNPNSFIYRFVPNNPTNLSAGGKLQALQVSINGSPVVFVAVDAAHPNGDVLSDNQLKLHTLGTSWPVKWVTVHDTDIQGTTAFDANAAAKAAGATPFKRPENLQFMPGSGFNTFFFAATGDTDKRAGDVAAVAERGAYGALFRVDFSGNGNAGRISIFTLGDEDHNSFDNVSFAGTSVLLVTEDRGDLLHDQLNTLDSVWAYDVRKPGGEAVRFIALGRDAPAAAAGAEDNEPTGIHFSDGASSIQGLVGKPLNQGDGNSQGNGNSPGGRLFFTQQHGDNVLWEVLGRHANDDDKNEDNDHGGHNGGQHGNKD